MPAMKTARIATSDGQTARLKAILEAGLLAVPAQSPNDGDRKLVDYVTAQLEAATVEVDLTHVSDAAMEQERVRRETQRRMAAQSRPR